MPFLEQSLGLNAGKPSQHPLKLLADFIGVATLLLLLRVSIQLIHSATLPAQEIPTIGVERLDGSPSSTTPLNILKAPIQLYMVLKFQSKSGTTTTTVVGVKAPMAVP